MWCGVLVLWALVGGWWLVFCGGGGLCVRGVLGVLCVLCALCALCFVGVVGVVLCVWAGARALRACVFVCVLSVCA